MRTLNLFDIARDFSLQEFESPDTNEVKIERSLVDCLQRLRDALDVPVVVSSGYRTREHNAALDGSPTSLHMEGKAADIYCLEVSRAELTVAAVRAGFLTVIAYKEKGFVHVAMGPKEQIIVPREWIPCIAEIFPKKRGIIFAFEDVNPSLC